MVDFSVLQLNSEQPIYCQLVEYVELLVVTGQAVSGQELPSRRLVSAQLGVNPNTVQKAYRQLEQQGLLESSAGAVPGGLLAKCSVWDWINNRHFL